MATCINLYKDSVTFMLYKIHSQPFSANMSLTIRFQSFRLLLTLLNLLLFSAVFVSMSILMLTVEKSFSINFIHLKGVFQFSFLSGAGFP